MTLLDYGQGQRRFKRPLMIPGEEVSVRINGVQTAIHINGIGISRLVEPIDAGEVVPTLQANVNAFLGAGGLVFNGHPGVNLLGAPGKYSYEEIWDGVLSAGKIMFGVPTDNSHHCSDYGPSRSNPGRGWVVVPAEELSQEAIVEGLASGTFYSSTGVMLEELEVSEGGVSLKVEQFKDFIYVTKFTGHDGKALAEFEGVETLYEIKGDKGYVRAVITSSSGQRAWTQPVLVG
jgi:hypothetical protein